MHIVKYVVGRTIIATIVFSCNVFSTEREVCPIGEVDSSSLAETENFVYSIPEYRERILKTPPSPVPLLSLDPKQHNNRTYVKFSLWETLYNVKPRSFSTDRKNYRNAPELEYLLLIERGIFKRPYSHGQFGNFKHQLSRTMSDAEI